MKTSGRRIILLFGDVAILAASFFLTLLIAFPKHFGQKVIEQHALPFALVYLLWILVLFLFNFYDIRSVKPSLRLFQRTGFAMVLNLIVGMGFFYVLPSFGIQPKTNLLINALLFALFFFLWRSAFYRMLRTGFRKNTVFIFEETNRYTDRLIAYIRAHPQSGFRYKAEFSTFTECLEVLQPEQIDLLITNKTLPHDLNSLKQLYRSNMQVWDFVHAYEALLSRVPIESIDESWVLHNVRSQRLRPYEFIQYIMGSLISMVILLLSLPVMLLTALAIKLTDGGPVLYSQKRVGMYGHSFNYYKFRSMGVDAEKGGAQWAQASDPRVTAVGRIIRKLHIDELPQLIHVITGDLALVGPRAERPVFVDQLEQEIPHYHLRHIIKPGFTGWAQIKYKYAGTLMESLEKFEYDLYYIKNRNLFMDIGIIIRTLQIIFTH